MSGAQGTGTNTRLLALCAALAAAAIILVGQTGVTGAEKDDPAQFTVAGDGELPTTRPDLGDSRESLTTEETGYAIRLASTDDSIGGDATDVHGEHGPEFLYADVPNDANSTGRKAIVVLYDYTTDTTHQQLVNLKTGTVSSTRARGVQPPPSPEEATAAVKIAIAADPPLTLAAQFEELEGVPLVSPDQVSYVAGAWTYDETTVGGRGCGTDRCVQLIVKTASGVYLDTTSVVVDLSKGRIVKLGSAS